MSENKSGFFDLPEAGKVCLDPEHKMPTHILIPKGKGYKHVCPACGKETVVIPQQTSLEVKKTKPKSEKTEIFVPAWLKQHNAKFGYN